MKKIVCLAIFCIVIAVSFTLVSASDNVAESKDIKIVINGKTGTYSDVPLIVNGRTMLPLREVLTNLGIQNDDEHIIWNGSKKCVTVKNDSKKIYLEVGNVKASVNDKIEKAHIEISINKDTYLINSIKVIIDSTLREDFQFTADINS